MPEQLSDDAKELLMQFQSYQQQMQNVMIQKETLKMQSLEIEKAVEELNGTKQENAYKIVGSVMVKKDINELKKELADSKEDFGLKIKSLDTVELKIKEKLKDLQGKLRNILKE